MESLSAIEAALWQEMARATHAKDHAWRTPVLATADGAVPDARTVVLREVERPLLRFFSDSRAPKMTQMQRQPQGLLVMWCGTLRWQLRLRVHLTLVDDAGALATRWARLQSSPAAGDYLSPQPPGSPLQTAAREDSTAVPHFAVVQALVSSIDWLELGAAGHRRAVFDAQGARWVQP
jgi:pyridoxamine 5'-phosphate oxidase